MHLNVGHVWVNFFTLVAVGGFLEISEGPRHMLVTCFGSSLVGFGFHGILAYSRARGASAAIYGVMWAQVATLALNWHEMSGRCLRTTVLVLMFAAESAFLVATGASGIAWQAHMAGGIAGCCITLVAAENVVWMRHELWLNLLGLVGYLSLVVVILASGQFVCGGLAAIVVPELLVETVWNFRKSSAHGDRVAASPAKVQPSPS